MSQWHSDRSRTHSSGETDHCRSAKLFSVLKFDKVAVIAFVKGCVKVRVSVSSDWTGL